LTWRFRRTVRLAPGLRLNVGKHGVSVTAGARGGPHYTVHSSGRHTVSASVPGTGLYWQQSFHPGDREILPESGSTRRGRRNHAPPSQPEPDRDTDSPAQPHQESRTRTARKHEDQSRGVGSWALGMSAAVGCAAAIGLRHGIALSPAYRPPLLVALLIILSALSVLAVRAAMRAAAPRRPALPVVELVRPIITSRPPPVRIVVLATKCFWCNRPLTDYRSRQLGAGPTCRARIGPHQTFRVNPDHVVWGNALHEARLRQETERPAVASRNAAATAAHTIAVAAWDVARHTPAAIAQQARRRLAVKAAWFTLACTLAAIPGGIANASGAPDSDPAPIAAAVVSQSPIAISTPPPPAESSLANTAVLDSSADSPDTQQSSVPAAVETTSTVQSVPSLTPTPLAPVRLSNTQVLHAIPDCVGGVCSLAARTDVMGPGSDGSSTQLTVALVRYPDDAELGNHYGFVEVDDTTMQEVDGAFSGTDQYSVLAPSNVLHQDVDGAVWAEFSSTGDFANGIQVVVMSATSFGLENEAPSDFAGGATAVRYLGLDGDGHHRWSADVPYDGSVVRTTYGWIADQSAYDAVACMRTLNGDSTSYAPSLVGCTT
jgi:hypothetical protein